MWNAKSVMEIVENYAGGRKFLAFFGICLLVLFCWGKINRRKEILIISIIALLFIFNDFMWKTFGELLEDSTYYRFLWIVPVLPVIAYVMVQRISQLPKKWEKVIGIILIVGILMIGGENYLQARAFRIPDNKYKISDDILATCELINDDKQEERPVVAFNMTLAMESRTYDPTILWAINKWNYEQQGSGRDEMADVLIDLVQHGQQAPAPVMAEALKSKQVNYIVIQKIFAAEDYLDSLNCQLVGETDAYMVYAVDLETNV